MADTPTDELVRFSLADVDRFAQASHDTNPLHTSEAYAHTTPFGRRVVHGMLAVIACLGRLPERAGAQIAQLQIDFKSPLFAGIPYRVEIAEKPSRATVRLFDGSRVALRIIAEFAPSQGPSATPRAGSAPRTQPVRASFSDLEEGSERAGSYGCAEGAIEALAARFGARLGALETAVLMASSYLVGMEAPGESALFARAVITFDPPAARVGALAFRLAVRERDERFDLVRLDAAFAIDGAPVATADLEAFVRPDPAALDVALLRSLSPPRAALAGRAAIVVGGSRGLGAAIALALADQGARVGLCYARARAAAERLAGLALAPGAITLLEADAADAAAFAPAARAFAVENGLDLLVCNACPALGTLSLDPTSLPRVLDHINRSVALVAVPIAATLDLLSSRPADLVVVSSTALADPPAEWPHYAAAKAAIEALARSTLAGTRTLRGLILRPPRLRTDLVGTPGSREQALAPEIVAARLVAALAEPHAPGATLIDAF